MLPAVLFYSQSFCRKGAENRLFSKSGFSAESVYEFYGLIVTVPSITATGGAI